MRQIFNIVQYVKAHNEYPPKRTLTKPSMNSFTIFPLADLMGLGFGKGGQREGRGGRGGG